MGWNRANNAIENKSIENGVRVAILTYPNSLKSAVYGLEELFHLASRLYREQHNESSGGQRDRQGGGEDAGPDIGTYGEQNTVPLFLPQVLTLDQLSCTEVFDVVILPPGQRSDFYLQPPNTLIHWLQQQAQSAVVCSACAGSFILAATPLLNGKRVTTHWAFESLFKAHYPNVLLDLDQILINEGSVITAGGMMSWLDLGFEVVAQYAPSGIVPLMGKYLVVDTGRRSQRFYRRFKPDLHHGDAPIRAAQEYLETALPDLPSVKDLAEQVAMGERTFLRRFEKVTQYKPKEYMQRLRIQKACERLEESRAPFETIAREVGYEDAGACRKRFIHIMGLTPSEFRQRFSEG